MDSKHRVTLPAKWRRDDSADEFYLLPDQSAEFLNVLPHAEFHRLQRLLMESSGFTEDQKRQVNRFYFSRAQMCDLDAQHRLLIPDEFCQELKFESELVLVGAVARIEIWNPQRWQQASQGVGAAACRDIINQIGG